MTTTASSDRSPLLSLLCVTQAEPHARAFLRDMARVVRSLPFAAEFVMVIDAAAPTAAGAMVGWERWLPADTQVRACASKGYIESILDEAVDCCRGDYILRLDDDEKINDPMRDWLARGAFQAAGHWKFDRAHLWGGDDLTYITAAPLWPDHQTRLSRREFAGGRGSIHAGSPFGGGTLAPNCVIEHHVFLVKSREERRAKMARYNQIHPGAGWPVFNVPEDTIAAANGGIPTAPYSTVRHPEARDAE